MGRKGLFTSQLTDCQEGRAGQELRHRPWKGAAIGSIDLLCLPFCVDSMPLDAKVILRLLLITHEI